MTLAAREAEMNIAGITAVWDLRTASVTHQRLF